MASPEGDPSNRVSVSSLPESLRNGNNTPESKESLSATERRSLAHAGRVLSRIENGHNTTPVRHEAYTIIQKGLIPQGTLEDRLMGDLTGSWRHIGTVPDSQLDTQYLPPKPSKDKRAA